MPKDPDPIPSFLKPYISAITGKPYLSEREKRLIEGLRSRGIDVPEVEGAFSGNYYKGLQDVIGLSQSRKKHSSPPESRVGGFEDRFKEEFDEFVLAHEIGHSLEPRDEQSFQEHSDAVDKEIEEMEGSLDLRNRVGDILRRTRSKQKRPFESPQKFADIVGYNVIDYERGNKPLDRASEREDPQVARMDSIRQALMPVVRDDSTRVRQEGGVIDSSNSSDSLPHPFSTRRSSTRVAGPFHNESGTRLEDLVDAPANTIGDALRSYTTFPGRSREALRDVGYKFRMLLRHGENPELSNDELMNILNTGLISSDIVTGGASTGLRSKISSSVKKQKGGVIDSPNDSDPLPILPSSFRGAPTAKPDATSFTRGRGRGARDFELFKELAGEFTTPPRSGKNVNYTGGGPGLLVDIETGGASGGVRAMRKVKQAVKEGVDIGRSLYRGDNVKEVARRLRGLGSADDVEESISQARRLKTDVENVQPVLKHPSKEGTRASIGRYRSDKHRALVSPKQNPEQARSTTVHEMSHAATLGPKSSQYGGKPLKQNRSVESAINKNINRSSSYPQRYLLDENYLERTEEVQARLNEIRTQIDPDNPWKQFKPKEVYRSVRDLENMGKKGVKKMLMKAKGDDVIEKSENLTNLLNKMFTTGAGAGVISQLQRESGGDKKKKGGVIKSSNTPSTMNRPHPFNRYLTPRGRNQLFLGGALDSVGDFFQNETVQTIGATAIGGPIAGALANDKARNWMAENPKATGTVVGGAAGLALGNPMLGAKLGGAAGGIAGQSSDSLGKSRQNRGERQRMLQRRQQVVPPGYGGSTGSYAARGGAIRMRGRGHEQGGIRLGNNNEVEGGETIQRSGDVNYAFSDRLNVPGTDKTFAELHKEIMERGGDAGEIENLASLQEKVAGRGTGGGSLEDGGYYASKEDMDTLDKGGSFQDGGILDIINSLSQGARRGRADLSDHNLPIGDYREGSPNLSRHNLPSRVEGTGVNQDSGAGSGAGEYYPGPMTPTRPLYHVENPRIPMPGSNGLSTVSAEDAPPGMGRNLIPPKAGQRGLVTPPVVNSLDRVLTANPNFDTSLPGTSPSGGSGGGNQPASSSSLPDQDVPNATQVDPAGRTESPSVEPSDITSNIPTNISTGGNQATVGTGSGSGSEGPGALDQALPYLPGAINAARGIFGSAEGADLPRMSIPRTAINEARNMDTDINVRPQLAEADQAFRSIAANPNTSGAQRQAAFSKLMRTRAGIRGQEENKETQLRNKRQQLVSRLTSNIDTAQAKANQQAGIREEMSQRKAEAAKSNLLTSGIAQMVGARRRGKARKAAQNRNLQQLATILGTMPPGARGNIARSLLGTVDDEQTSSFLRDMINRSQ